MYPYPAMKLIMESHFVVGVITSPRKLDTVHPQVAISQTRLRRAFRVDLGQSYERTTIPWPGDNLGKLADAGLMGKDRAAAHPAGQEMADRGNNLDQL
jgi:hypothetical protein